MTEELEGFHARQCTSEAMQRAIGQWFDLYFEGRTTGQEDPCQRIPYTIVHKLTRAVFGEYEAKTGDAFAAGIVRALDARRKKAMQMALIGGECLLRPVPGVDGFTFRVVSRNNMRVFGRDADGGITDLGLSEKTMGERFCYTLLERRSLGGDGLTITNRLFRSDAPGVLGRQVPLASLPDYAELPEKFTLPGTLGIGLASLKIPVENCVDGSEEPVSVYAAAVGLIHGINRNEAQLNGEFSRGESRIITSSDMLRDGKLEDHIFVGLDEDPQNVGVTIFSPQLRESSFLSRKEDYLRSVENVIGLKRGVLSQPETMPRTATEITSTAGDYHLTVMDLRQAWEETVRQTLALCGALGELYQMPGAKGLTGAEVGFNWGNGVLFD